MAGLEFKGYFVDAGTPSSFIEAVKVCISNKRFEIGSIHDKHTWISDKVLIDEPFQITGSSISKNVSIGKGCEILDCVILSGAKIGEGCKLQRCLIGESSIIKRGSVISDKVIGHGEMI